jgi:hypothetical protein
LYLNESLKGRKFEFYKGFRQSQEDENKNAGAGSGLNVTTSAAGLDRGGSMMGPNLQDYLPVGVNSETNWK